MKKTILILLYLVLIALTVCRKNLKSNDDENEEDDVSAENNNFQLTKTFSGKTFQLQNQNDIIDVTIKTEDNVINAADKANNAQANTLDKQILPNGNNNNVQTTGVNIVSGGLVKGGVNQGIPLAQGTNNQVNPAFNAQTIAPAVNTQPIFPVANTQTIAPAVNTQTIAPAINNLQQNKIVNADDSHLAPLNTQNHAQPIIQHSNNNINTQQPNVTTDNHGASKKIQSVLIPTTNALDAHSNTGSNVNEAPSTNTNNFHQDNARDNGRDNGRDNSQAIKELKEAVNNINEALTVIDNSDKDQQQGKKNRKLK